MASMVEHYPLLFATLLGLCGGCTSKARDTTDTLGAVSTSSALPAPSADATALSSTPTAPSAEAPALSAETPAPSPEAPALSAGAPASASAAASGARRASAPFYCFSWVHLREGSTDCYRSYAACEQERKKMEGGARPTMPCRSEARAFCTRVSRPPEPTSSGTEKCFGTEPGCDYYRAYIGRGARGELTTIECKRQ